MLFTSILASVTLAIATTTSVIAHPATGAVENNFSLGLLVENQDKSDVHARRSLGLDNGKRSLYLDEAHLYTRDGELVLPESFNQAQALANSAVGFEKRGTAKLRVTYYDEPSDLKHPSCGDWRLGGKWYPGNNHLIAAVTTDNNWKTSQGKPKCKQFIKVSCGGKSVIVRIVDSCAGHGCAVNGNRTVDLTRKGFSTLRPLRQGIITGCSIRVVSKPGGSKFSSADIKKYGPVRF